MRVEGSRTEGIPPEMPPNAKAILLRFTGRVTERTLNMIDRSGTMPKQNITQEQKKELEETLTGIGLSGDVVKTLMEHPDALTVDAVFNGQKVPAGISERDKMKLVAGLLHN